MHDFVRKLVTEWRRLDLPFEGQTVVVGVSGGADSVSLLLGLAELREAGKLKLRLVAAHFNHQLRGNDSDADEQFVRELTTRHKIELAIGHPDRPIDAGNIEQKAREARYRFLARTAKGVDAVAVLTGHTINDQAETFLINLVRGSGPDGLCGIRPVRPMDDEPPPQPDGCEPISVEHEGDWLFPVSPLLVRPLVSWAKRKDTEGYVHDLGVDYRYDTMNEDTAFKRVRIRKILLPLLQDFNPNIIDVLANTARLMQGHAPQADRPVVSDELRIADLQAMDSPELFAAIRTWLSSRRGGLREVGLKHVEAIARLVKSHRSGRVAELPGFGRVVKGGGSLRFEENKVEKTGGDL